MPIQDNPQFLVPDVFDAEIKETKYMLLPKSERRHITPIEVYCRAVVPLFKIYLNKIKQKIWSLLQMTSHQNQKTEWL
jgi:hypothetical protein